MVHTIYNFINVLTYFVLNTILTVYFMGAYTVPGKRTSFVELLINALQGPPVQYMGEEDRGDADIGKDGRPASRSGLF